MVRVLRIFVVVAALLAVATPAVAKGPGHMVPIKGTVMGEHWPPAAPVECPADYSGWRFSSAGEGGVGLMSHLGRVAEYSLTQCSRFVDPELGTVESVGEIELTAANGDILRLTHIMRSQLEFGPTGPIGFPFEGDWTAVGGTGRFAIAEGQGTFHGVGDIGDEVASFGIPDGLLQLNFEGEIAYKRK